VKENTVMGTARRVLLAIAAAAPAAMTLSAGPAAAQMPWPGDAQPQRSAPWPGSPAPTGMMAPPPAMGGGGPGPGMGGPGPGMGGGGQPPCMGEFVKLREEVEKRGKIAKAASEHKANREEMCKLITTFAEVEGKWAKFTEVNTQTSCGIPAQVATQLKQMHANTEQTRQRICSGGGGPAGVPAGPSIHDALNLTTTTLDTAKKGIGTWDTLTNSR
jgi:hypothetical protein